MFQSECALTGKTLPANNFDVKVSINDDTDYLITHGDQNHELQSLLIALWSKAITQPLLRI